MVPGFNTNITSKGVAYHVQTELTKDAAAQTLVYVGGAIVHAVRTFYRGASQSLPADQTGVRQWLEEQHRRVIAQVRSGEICPTSPR